MVRQMKFECLVDQDRPCYRIYQERRNLRPLGLRSLLSKRQTYLYLYRHPSHPYLPWKFKLPLGEVL